MFKRLENIKDTNLTQLQAIKNCGEQQLRELKDISKSNMIKVIDEIRRRNQKADKILLEVKMIDTKLDTTELVCTKIDGTKYNFNIFGLPLKFVEKIHNYGITLDEAMDDQGTKIMICLIHILVFQHLLIWQNNYMKQKIKRKTLSL